MYTHPVWLKDDYGLHDIQHMYKISTIDMTFGAQIIDTSKYYTHFHVAEGNRLPISSHNTIYTCHELYHTCYEKCETVRICHIASLRKQPQTC